MEVKNLFIPLKRKHWENFQNGSKNVEYRKWGPRWNEKTVWAGRKATLSLGYGKAHREVRTIVAAHREWADSPEWISCYGEAGWACAIYLPREIK